MPETTEQIMGDLECSIIIPVYNQCHFTRRCLETIRRHTNDVRYEVIVVNDGSTDETSEYLKSLEPPFHAIRNEQNLGFTGSVNRAAAEAQGKYLLLFNNDTEVHPDWLREMIDLMESDRLIGIVGAKLLYPNGTIQHIGVDINHHLVPFHPYRGSSGNDPSLSQIREMVAVTGACLLISKELFHRVGGLDKRYRMYFEDIDLCLSVRQLGYRVMVNPRAVVTHHETQSIEKTSAEKIAEQSYPIFLEKWSRTLLGDRLLVGVDVRTLQFVASNMRGIGHYVYHSLEAVIASSPDAYFTLYGDKIGETTPEIRRLVSSRTNCVFRNYQQFHPAVVDVFWLTDPLTPIPESSSEQMVFKPMLPADLGEVPLVANAYDLIPLIFEHQYLAENHDWAEEYKRRLSWLSSHIQHFFALSECTRKDYSQYLEIASDRISVVGGGIAGHFLQDANPELANEIRDRLQSQCPVILYVGSLDPRKNPDGLLETIQKIKSLYSNDFRLIIVGAAADEEVEKIKQLAAHYGAEDRVLMTGYVSPEVLRAIQQVSTLFLFPSKYEGFGLPVLEAMAAGLPVVCSNRSSLMEVAADAAILCDPDDTNAMAREAVKLMTDNPYRQKYIQLGLERARQFTWQRVADKMRNILLRAGRRPSLLTALKPKAKETPFAQQYQELQASIASIPISLTYEAPMLDISGYASMARNLVLGLNELNVDVRAKSMWFSGMYDVHPVKLGEPAPPDSIRLSLDNGEMVEYRTQVDPPTVNRIMKLIAKPLKVGADSIYVLHHIPAGLGNDNCQLARQINPGHGYYICSTMFETHAIPQDWRDALLQMDEIWVPSHFNQETFSRGGVPADRLRVLPLGIDPARYDPEKVGHYPIPGLRKFNFLSVFQWTKRKGWDVLLRAYLQAFHPDDDVALVIRSYYGKGSRVEALIEQYLSELKVPPDRIPPIIVIGQRIPDAEMPSLYNACDAFVLPSRGEGWGIPYMEAMTLGKPVIATNWSGNTEFMTGENSLLIDTEGLKEVDRDQIQDCPLYAGQMLAEPSVDGCAQYMRFVFEHPEEASKIGARARKDILENWTVKHQAYRVAQRLTEIRDRLRLGKIYPSYASSVEQKGSTGNFPPGIREENTKGGDESLPPYYRRGEQKGGSPYIKKSSLKILFQNRHNALTHPGGDTEVMNQLKSELEALQVQINFSPEPKDVQEYDLVHLFNVTILPTSHQFAENVIQQVKSYVITSLYEDWPRYLNLSYEIIPTFKKYLDSNQNDEEFQQEMERLKQLPRHNPLNNEYVVSNALCHFCCSDTERKALTGRFPNIRRCEIIPFAPTLSISAGDGGEAFRKEFGLKDFILCVGRLESRKNQLMLLKALEHENIPLIFATGGFTYQQIYEDLCRRYRRKGQTMFLNRLTPELLTSAFQAARLHVLPSWYELPGLVSLEAAAFGTGVAGSSWGALPDYLGDSAYYFSPDNPDEMRDVILKAWENPKGDDARYAVSRFSWSESARKTLEIYQELCETIPLSKTGSYNPMWEELRTKVERGDVRGAITQLESHWDAEKNNPVYLYQLGELYAKIGNAMKAQEIMAQLNALDSIIAKNQPVTTESLAQDSVSTSASKSPDDNIPQQESLPMVRTFSHASPEIHRPLRVSLFTLKSTEACFYVRLIAPLEELERQGKIALDYPVRFEGNTILNPVIPDYTDVAIFQRSFINMDPFKASIEWARELGKVVMYEIDDLLIDVPDWHPQKDMFQWGIPFIKRHLSMASHVTVSSERLKSNLMAYNPFITVIPNTVDPRLWRDPDRRHQDRSPVVIGYTGTVTHLGDIRTIVLAIEEILKRYGGRVAFKFWGLSPKELFEKPGVTFDREYIADYPKYANDLTNADFDIMLVPLAPCEFNECKSPMKWLEYSMAGIPGIYQDLTPYKGLVKHGHNGMLASDPNSWANAMTQLIENPDLRRKIAETSRREVLENHSILKSAAAWEKCMKQCLGEVASEIALNLPERKTLFTPTVQKAENPLCSIVIPVFNLWHLTRKCLESLYETVDIPCEVIVVDNGSTDDTPRELAAMISRKSSNGNITVKTIRFEENLGFSKACNAGAKAAHGKYVIFLNNDTNPQSGWLRPLIEEISQNPDVAVVGGKLLYPDGTIQHAGIVFSQDKIPFLIYRGFGKGHHAVNQPRDFPAVSAACMCVPRDLFLQLDGFDESYQNGFEDVDFCLKVAQLKAEQNGKETVRRRIRYCPASVVVHHEESTPGRKEHDSENLHRFLEKWGDQIQPSDEEYLRADGLAIDWISSSSGRYITLIEKTERLIREAKELEKQGALSRALELLDDIVRLNPDQDDIYAWMSQIYTAMEQLEKAESCLETAPKTTKTTLALAEAQIKRQRIEEAAAELMELKQHIEALSPEEHSLACLLLGNCKVHQNRLDEAETLFQEALTVNESWERPYLSLGSVNLLRNQFDRAEQNFQDALKRNPDQSKAHFGLGMVRWNRGDRDGGLQKYMEALDGDINHTQALYSLTTAASELGRWEVAAEYLERYVVKNPSHLDFLYSLGGIYYRMGRMNDAQDICQRILRQQPDHEATRELSKKIQREGIR